MISLFRAFLNTWAARIFFLLLVGVFVAWGVGGDVFRMIGDNASVATVGNRRIEVPEATDAYRRQLAQVTRSLGTNIEPTPEIRRAVAAQALQGLIVQAAMENAVSGLGLVVPDDVLRDAVFNMQAFRGADGKFSRDVFQTVLRNNNYTESRFLDLMRADLAQRQLVSAVRAGLTSPDELNTIVYAFQHELRVADAVSFPFSTTAAPAEPTEAQLARWYENHKDQYSTPERRSFTLALLAPDTVMKDIAISDDDLAAAWEAAKANFQKPERRSVQVILTQDADKAQALAAVWATGTDWAEMQKKAQEDGAAAVELNSAVRDEFPAPELADAVFAAQEGIVPLPVKSALGWHILKVTAIEPAGTKSFDEVKPLLRSQLQAEKAADLIDANASKLEDLLTGGTKLAELPPDLGISLIKSTTDAAGLDADAKPVPLPGDEGLRAAILAEIFRTKQGDPARLIDAPRQQGAPPAYYAITVDGIAPPTPRPMAEIAPQIRADWTKDAIRHAREEQAAAMLAAIKSGKTLAAAAVDANLTPVTLPPVGRASPAPGVPLQLIEPLFSLKAGEPTMIETEDGFMVATLAEIRPANAAADPIGYGQVRDALTRSMGDDLQAALAFAVRDRASPKINRTLADRIAVPE
jgi:peptidyl-prolyl cis-trans isomerase D